MKKEWCTSTNFKLSAKNGGKGTCELSKHNISLIKENIVFHEQQGVIFTLKCMENVTLYCSWKTVFSLTREMSCLFSSQVPLPLFLADILKFVEEHHSFLIHEWLQDNKLADSNHFATYPFSRLFRFVMLYTEREDVDLSLSGKTSVFNIQWKKKWWTKLVFFPFRAFARRKSSMCKCNKKKHGNLLLVD